MRRIKLFLYFIFLIPVYADAQQALLYGVVKDSTQQRPLDGAYVFVSGATDGSYTDAN